MNQTDHGRSQPIRVALSDDYELVLVGLAQMFADYPSRVQVVDLSTQSKMPHEADIVLYDTFGRLPVDDLKLRKVVQQNRAKVVVYSWDQYPEDVARSSGAVGYVSKGLSAEDLVAALEAIHEGAEPKPAEHDGEPDLLWPGQVVGLSQRESEMLSFITRGLTNEEIAQRSYLSINSVKTYIRTAYRKIDVRNRAEAVAWGYQNGFYGTDDTGV